MRIHRASLLWGMFACLLPLWPAAAQSTDTGWFVGGDIGPSSFGDYELEAQSTVLDDDDVAWSIFGGYQVMSHFGASLAWVDLGQLNASGPAFGGFSDVIEADGLEVMATGMLPLGQVDLFAEVGLFSWNQDVTYSDAGGPFRGDASGESPIYGVGANWDIIQDDGIGLTFSWKRYSDVGDFDRTGHENDVDVIAAGAYFLFGR